MDTYIHMYIIYVYKKINYAATATVAGAAFAHPCPPPLEIFLLCLPSLCLYVIVCIRLCVCVCIDVVTNSHFLCLGSRTLKLLICCANVQTISQRRVDEHGETECLSYVCVCVSSSGYSTTSSIASPSLSNIFLSLSLNILSTILVSILGNQPKQMSFKIISINCSHQQRAYIHTHKHSHTYIHRQTNLTHSVVWNSINISKLQLPSRTFRADVQ